MNDATSDRPVSRSDLERERQARLAAEALLEAKSRELIAMNHRLMAETEAVRDALADMEALRQREVWALRSVRSCPGAQSPDRQARGR